MALAGEFNIAAQRGFLQANFHNLISPWHDRWEDALEALMPKLRLQGVQSSIHWHPGRAGYNEQIRRRWYALMVALCDETIFQALQLQLAVEVVYPRYHLADPSTRIALWNSFCLLSLGREAVCTAYKRKVGRMLDWSFPPDYWWGSHAVGQHQWATQPNRYIPNVVHHSDNYLGSGPNAGHLVSAITQLVMSRGPRIYTPCPLLRPFRRIDHPHNLPDGQPARFSQAASYVDPSHRPQGGAPAQPQHLPAYHPWRGQSWLVCWLFGNPALGNAQLAPEAPRH
ncbi:hypothetical protein M231_03887 [Tremella mesenterica]|uniref:Uncharacterized protein n=1 Tax=Tremella mesenterica TaxID=5217 RepID=A0A4Q1BLZ4_TREME|nr:hypothetical protein M231_03887 [Tremella mesenterica]